MDDMIWPFSQAFGGLLIIEMLVVSRFYHTVRFHCTDKPTTRFKMLQDLFKMFAAALNELTQCS